MSSSVSIDIKLCSDNAFNEKICRLFIIECLLNHGWSTNDHDNISYLPVGDIDNFEWYSDKISEKDLLSIIKEKEKREELIGLVLTWENSNIGGEFLIFLNGVILINLNINRKTLNEEFTDINWYLSRILKPLKRNAFRVESITFTEHI